MGCRSHNKERTNNTKPVNGGTYTMTDRRLKVHYMSTTVDVRTPQYILEELRKEFGELYDPCPIGGSDGLITDWESPAYINPPYGREIVKWTKKALEESNKGVHIIMLLPARTDTGWFHDHVLPNAKEIRFVRGRIKFEGYESGAPFPPMLVIL